MKIELVKETKWDGDIFFRILIDGEYKAGDSIYGGNTETTSESRREELEQQAHNLYDKCKEGYGVSVLEILKSDILE